MHSLSSLYSLTILTLKIKKYFDKTARINLPVVVVRVLNWYEIAIMISVPSWKPNQYNVKFFLGNERIDLLLLSVDKIRVCV